MSIPMDDWGVEVDDATPCAHAIARRSAGRAGADPEGVAELARRLEAARNR